MLRIKHNINDAQQMHDNGMASYAYDDGEGKHTIKKDEGR